VKSLGSSIFKNLKERGLSQKLHAALVVEYLKELLEKDLTKEQLSSLISLAYRDKTIILKASSPALMQEVRLRQKSYLDALNAKFGPSTADKITFS